jgi:hypothetical protein
MINISFKYIGLPLFCLGIVGVGYLNVESYYLKGLTLSSITLCLFLGSLVSQAYQRKLFYWSIIFIVGLFPPNYWLKADWFHIILLIYIATGTCRTALACLNYTPESSMKEEHIDKKAFGKHVKIRNNKEIYFD